MKSALIKILFFTVFFLTHSLSLAIPSDGSVFIFRLTASAPIIKVGNPVTIQWGTVDAFSCGLTTNLGSNSVPVNGSTTITPVNTSLMVVTLTCVNQAGQPTSRTISFPVNAADHPELLSFSASSSSVNAGQQVTLSWTSEFADECMISGETVQTVAPNGSTQVTVQPGQNLFLMTCLSNDGRESNILVASVTGIVIAPRIFSFFAFGDGSPFYSISWNADADTCILDGIPVATSGFQSQIAFSSGLQIHRLDCSIGNQTTTAFATYTVN